MRWKPERPERGAERWVLRFARTPVLCEEGVWVWLEWVMCNGHGLFTARTLNDAADAVQYLKALCAVQEQEATDE